MRFGMASRSVAVNSQRALTGSRYASLPQHERVIVHVCSQVALSLIKNSESQEREMARQRGHQQLVDMIAVLLEEVRKIGQFKTSELPQLCELLQVSLAWSYCVDA